MVDCAEDRDGGKNGLGQRQDDLIEPLEVVGTVQRCTFFQCLRNGLDVGLDQNQIIRHHDAGQNVGKEVVGQTQHGHIQIPRDDTGIQVHGQHHETIPEAAMPHLLLGEDVACQRTAQHHDDGADDGTSQRDHQCLSKVAQLQHSNIVAEVDALGDKVDLTGRNEVVV